MHLRVDELESLTTSQEQLLAILKEIQNTWKRIEDLDNAINDKFSENWDWF